MNATSVLVVLLTFAQESAPRPAIPPYDPTGASLAVERLEAEVEALRQALERVLPGGAPTSRPSAPDGLDLEGLGVDPTRLRRIRALEMEVLHRRETLAALRLRLDPDLLAEAALAAATPASPSGGEGETPVATTPPPPKVQLPEYEATTALRSGDAKAALRAFEGRAVEGADPSAQYAIASALVAQGRIEDAIPILQAIANRADRPLLQSAAERRLKALEKKRPAASRTWTEGGRREGGR